MARVVLAMSGGVDSSVAAHLLLEQGHDVIGVFMRHGHESPVACSSDQLPIINRLDHKQGCCTAADAEDARRVAERLAIPFYALNLDREFGQIIDYFVEEYTAGRTPNPCVQCNNWIKFGKLFDYADSVDAQYVATGHYARLHQQANPDGTSEASLLRGCDSNKDQSYVLFGIQRRYLSRMLLPVGEYEKPQIRDMAAGLGLNVADKKDSQEICFVTQGRYDEFVRGERKNSGQDRDTSGELVTTDGTVVGQHQGIEGFTVGQRKGLGVALGEPKFVVRIEPDTRRVVLGDRSELTRPSLTAANTNWLVDHEQIPQQCQVQIRYNAPPVEAQVELLPEDRLQVTFDEPQFGVAPARLSSVTMTSARWAAAGSSKRMPMARKQKAWLIVVPAMLLAGVAWLFYFWLFPPFTPPVLPVPNGYDDLLRAAEMLAPRTGFYNEMDETELASVVEQNRPALALAREALQKECMVPINWSPIPADTQANLDRVSSLRELSRAFAAEAKHEIDSENEDLMVTNGLDIIKLAQAGAKGGLVVDSFTCHAIELVGIETLHKQIEGLSHEQCTRLIKELKSTAVAGDTSDDVFQREREYNRRLNGVWTSLVTAAAMRSLDQELKAGFVQVEQQIETKHSLLQTHLALNLHKLDEGTYPQTLDKLVPDYLSEMPQDIFSGKPLIYRLQGEGYLLYSVGPDGKDDNGVAIKTDQTGDLLLESEQ